MKSLPTGIVLTFLLLAAQAGASDMCSLIQPGQLEAVLGAKITGKSEYKGALSVACNYKLAAGPVGGPGLFFLERFTIPVPPGNEQDLTMRTPKSKFIDVPGVGDKAFIVDDSFEMIVRKGPNVYHFATRAVPCEKTAPASQDEKLHCNTERNDMLKAVAKLVVAL